ncbi:uncharacterized protein BXZ73DRAFT_104246 [Epithele typhae]|uniref:uncharacterized protein n=1 Tax=Epithele typhae TaxID=378194 RepID=UPI0020081001|nr:uncharacterized protein BXZ73DRAFT_104246 [Epithele typhae]KAH9921988.1 hypothetical protein BXZ73DRAFT_104246 [Epithele typhae]
MTALYDPQSVEARKARYSRELAAYTLRQWDMAQQAGNEGTPPLGEPADARRTVAVDFGASRLGQDREAASGPAPAG